jgi:hypothetical protein
MEPNYQELALAALDAPQDAAVLVKLRQAINDERGRELLLSIVELGKRNGASDGIQGAMSLFESMEDTSPVVAGYFMALLYPIASDALMHEVCDGIAMSIALKHCGELAPILRTLAGNETDEDVARHYREWAANLERS